MKAAETGFHRRAFCHLLSIAPLRIVTGRMGGAMAAAIDVVRVGVTIPATCSRQGRVRMADTRLRSGAVHRTADHALHLYEPFDSRGRFRWSNVTEQHQTAIGRMAQSPQGADRHARQCSVSEGGNDRERQARQSDGRTQRWRNPAVAAAAYVATLPAPLTAGRGAPLSRLSPTPSAALPG